ncbi:hypothetical protein RhiirA4_416823 [Rhizophagus irregularis]|uniref:Uncharacterized protein n=1 Tax=Rhizophagus irregularis TaxID=588596 RepID=A0A2I1G4T7_9GLOM|nr:hypothetical protein RhiirA4_416823 [Rhizophagus irregularis]
MTLRDVTNSNNVSRTIVNGVKKLLEYLDSHKPEEWPLSQFLLLYRDKILAAPFHDDWHALDGAWTRRFIRAVQERNEKIDLKTKDDHDESDEVDNFFKSPSEKKSSNLFLQKKDNSAKKQQKSSNERGSNEADDEKRCSDYS